MKIISHRRFLLFSALCLWFLIPNCDCNQCDRENCSSGFYWDESLCQCECDPSWAGSPCSSLPVRNFEVFLSSSINGDIGYWSTSTMDVSLDGNQLTIDAYKTVGADENIIYIQFSEAAAIGTGTHSIDVAEGDIGQIVHEYTDYGYNSTIANGEPSTVTINSISGSGENTNLDADFSFVTSGMIDGEYLIATGSIQYEN